MTNYSTCLLSAGHLINATVNHYLHRCWLRKDLADQARIQSGYQWDVTNDYSQTCPFDLFCLCCQVIWCNRSKAVGWCSPCWASCVSTVLSLRVLFQTRFDLIPWTEIHHWRNGLKTAQRTGFYLRPSCSCGMGCIWRTFEVEFLFVARSYQAVFFKLLYYSKEEQ